MTEPVTCDCECHGPNVGFYHCFGPPCCSDPERPKDAATVELRAKQVAEADSHRKR